VINSKTEGMVKHQYEAINIPGYRITELIYVLKKTSVYRGEEEKTKTPVFIKVLNAKHPEFLELISLKNQFVIIQQIDHPHIIKCHSLVAYDKSYALVLEDFGGISLHKYIASTTLGIDEFLNIALAITKALEYLFQKRIIHKDIRPANILINLETKQVKLVNFNSSSLLPKENVEIKGHNLLEGTLAYMSPEQTGRMNRGVDYRSDYYSLGVTFYELLTGILPFHTTNPLELVHCHLAQQPINSKVINPEIPQVLANIIHKLMAKTAEERYQTARGIRQDIETCQQMLLNQGEISDFPLGLMDVSDRFLICAKLYGREKEVNTLLASFARVSNGNKELMLVAGFSGIGKTAVVYEVYKPIVKQQGYFISGKYDQLKRDIPFSALVQAFRSLMTQLLTENINQLQKWKNKILSALGEQGKVITDVIPELAKIIGEQSEVTELSGSASQNRFNLLFRQFMQIFATKEHPLVIFLDDLQWVDTASLKLIQLLMSESEVGYLLIIGAFRDNEVNPGHPFLIALNNIRQSQAIVNQITLNPLDKSDFGLLIKDTLNCPESQALPLTELVFNKTQGNPFFANQLLKSLHEAGLITFNFDLVYWQFDIHEIQALYQHDDIIEFLAIQLQKLPNNVQNILKIASCIGNQFDLNTLSIVCEKSPLQTASDLWIALQEELILYQNEGYQLFNHPIDSSTLELDVNGYEKLMLEYKFAHDRIQQAAYSLIPQNEQQATHLKIGRLILNHTNFAEITENVFEIVNHLNLGSDLIINRSEKYELARLNLIAGHKAKLSTAYDSAVRYLNSSIKMLAVDSWQIQYELTLDIYNEIIEAEYLNLNFEQAEIYINIVKENAINLIDQVKAYEAKIQIYMAEAKTPLAIETGLNLINMLGFDLERVPPSNLNVESLIDLPQMTDPDKLAVMRILANMTAACYFVDPALFPAVVFTMVHLSITYGNSPTSAHGYVNYGLLLSSYFSDIDTGYRYGELALNLLNKFNIKSIKCRVLLIWNSNIVFWKKHLNQTIQSLLEALQSGCETGDLEYVGYCSAIYNLNMILSGENLAYTFEQLENHVILMHNFKKQTTFIALHRIWQQFVFHFLEVDTDKQEFVGVFFDESIKKIILANRRNSTAIFSLYLAETILFYFFADTKKAVASATSGEIYLDFVVGQVTVNQHNFYYSLALLAEYPNQSPDQQKRYLQKVSSNQEYLRDWSYHAPVNNQHKYYLVEAEKARVLGNNWQAMELYDRAISEAKENKYIQEEGLANELAAKFYLSHRKVKIAQNYLMDAYYCYSDWGSVAKVEDLKKLYSELIIPILNQKLVSINPSNNSDIISNLIPDNSSKSVFALLDLETITKASLAISSEIEIEKLLHRLMQVIIENVGAEKSALILQQDGKLILVAHAQLHQRCQIKSVPIINCQEVPISLINYVFHTREDLLINNASVETQFARDAYILQQQPKSILCTPILNQGQLTGIFYLENTLTAGVFTPERLKILKLLSSQAAISLENAQLYASLTEKVAERTKELNDKNLYLEQTLNELQITQSQLVQTEKMSSLGQMVAGIAHEINNPLNFISANIQPANRYIEDLLDLVKAYQQEYPYPTPLIQEIVENMNLDFLKQDIKKILSSMLVGAERIHKIVLGLRNFSRLDESHMKPVDIHEGIESTLIFLQPKFQENLSYSQGQDILIKEYGQLPLVNCYASQLNQVFLHILSNAIDALGQLAQVLTPAEYLDYSPKITIRTQALNDDWVRISFQDNGLGMTPEVKNRIFDPFFTTKPVGKGTGLGLSISYQVVVNRHRGRIECISVLGKGTEFLVDIPTNLSSKNQDNLNSQR